MRNMIVARSYAGALFELGERHDAHDEFVEGLNALTSLIMSDVRIRSFLETPKIPVARKKQAMRAALGSHVSPLFMNFVLVVLQKHRQRMLDAMAAGYGELLDARLGRLHAQVTLAHEPDEALERHIAEGLSRTLSRTVIPRFIVEPAILGGVVVRYGDHVMDGSLRRRLGGLRRRLVAATLPATRPVAA